MPWGDVAEDGIVGSTDASVAAAGTGRKRRGVLQEAACGHWEAFLESRKRARVDSGELTSAGSPAPATFPLPVAWGEISSDYTADTCKIRFAVEVHLSGKSILHVKDGRALASCLPTLWSCIHQISEVDSKIVSKQTSATTRTVDLDASFGTTNVSGLQSRAVNAAVRFAMQTSVAGVGSAMRSNSSDVAELWHGADIPRASARGSLNDEEARIAEDALHAFDIWRAAALLEIPRLQQAAEARLLGDPDISLSTSLLKCGDAAAMLVFAASWGQGCRTVSAACLRHLTTRAKVVLFGRERQLGVLYATHAVAASALSGILRTALADISIKATPSGATNGKHRAADPVLAELLFGLGGSASYFQLEEPASDSGAITGFQHSSQVDALPAGTC